jgi:acyl carrier protein
MTTVEQEIRTFLVENFSLGGDINRLPGNRSLTERGIIDSVGIVEVLTFLETQYDISINDDETVPENIDTIDNMVRFVATKRSGAEVPVRAAGA